MKDKPNFHVDFPFFSPLLLGPNMNESLFRVKCCEMDRKIAQRRSSCLSEERGGRELSISSKADEGRSFTKGDQAA